MKIPNFIKTIWTDKEGSLTAEGNLYHDQLSQYLKTTISEEGFEIPQNTTSDITRFSDPTNPNFKPDGTIWYDSDTKQFKGKINGVVKVFTLV
jgi:hypothetical protein